MGGSGISIAYIGGGSMNFGWKWMGELAEESALSGIVRLYDADKQMALANEVIGNKLRESPGCKSGMIYLAVDTLEEALRDADFVLLSISQGSLEETVADIHLPEMFGIYQAVGESAGPGGIMRAVRTLPVYREFARKIKEYCPKAWVINLSNPMGPCLEMLQHEFPEIKLFGCSKEPLSGKELLAEMVTRDRQLAPGEGNPAKIETSLSGIPCFSWFTKAVYEGEDLFPLFHKFAQTYGDSGYEKRAGEYRVNPAASGNLVKFDLFLRYGVISAVPDRYAAEFCPPWYLKTPKAASQWKFGLTSVNYLKKRRQDKIARSRKMVSGAELLEKGPSGTECVAQIKALLGMGEPLFSTAGMINRGQAPDLPAGAAVQTNAVFSQDSVRPILSESLPAEVAALTERHLSNQKILVKAVLEKDLDVAFNAFLNDPLMTADLESATELYKEMLSSIRSQLLYYC